VRTSLAARSTRRGRRRGPRWGRILYFLLLAAIGSLTIGLWLLSRLELPDAGALDDQTTIVRDRNGVEIARFHAEENRIPRTLDEISPVMIDAVVAAEDRDFFTHPGVDPVAIARAAWADVRSRGALQGGSTITQQYVKNAFLTSDRTLVRKLEEAALAIKLEREMSKEQILEGYLNVIYFGRGAYGVEAAARVWFGVGAADLDLAQSAYLAGLIRAPEAADVSRPDQMEVAYRRRRSVLEAMREMGTITPDEFDTVNALPIESYTLPRSAGSSVEISQAGIGLEYFVDMVRARVADEYGNRLLFRGGLDIVTTLDVNLQRGAWDAMREYLTGPNSPEGATVVLDDKGAVVALIGGRNRDVSEVNLALGTAGGGSGRQPGSAFKPLVLTEALRQGLTLDTVIDSPATITVGTTENGEPWTVSNYDDREHGPLTLEQATVVSSNTVYAQVIDRIGPEAVVGTAASMGISAPLDPVDSVALGTQEVSVLDMAVAYSTLAHRGDLRPSHIIERISDREGNEMEAFTLEAERVIEPSVADEVTRVLEKVISEGTGRAAAVSGVPTAGKTGTTQNYGDAWFVGYTPRFTAAVWVGYADSNRAMVDVLGVPRVTGGSIPARIWSRIMESAHVGIDPGAFPAAPPEGS